MSSPITFGMLQELRRSLPAHLPAFLMRQRWFGGKARRISSTEIVDVVFVNTDSLSTFVVMINVMYVEGSPETYAVPLSHVTSNVQHSGGKSAIFKLVGTRGDGTIELTDALKDEQFLQVLLGAIDQREVFRGDSGEISAHQTITYDGLNLSSLGILRSKPLTGEQSNSSIIYGDRLILKFFRRMEAGINPDVEIGAFLTEKAHFPNVPQIAGWLEYRTSGGKQMTQAILQTYVPNQGDAWRYTLKSLGTFYESLAKKPELNSLLEDSSPKLPPKAAATLASYLDLAGLLGRRTAELHLALASERNDPAFAPEPFTPEFQRSHARSVATLTSNVFALLREKTSTLPEQQRESAESMAARENELGSRFAKMLAAPIPALRTRVHGDYHLGQVLYTGTDFVIIDFEGEPARSLAERRIKQSPLQDVAGMLRSFHYAAFAPLIGSADQKSEFADDAAGLSRWAECWNAWVSDRFLEKYFEVANPGSFLPLGTAERKNLLDLYLLEKSIYELGYELNNRPTWVGIPLKGIAQLLAS